MKNNSLTHHEHPQHLHQQKQQGLLGASVPCEEWGVPEVGGMPEGMPPPPSSVLLLLRPPRAVWIIVRALLPVLQDDKGMLNSGLFWQLA